LSIRWHLDQIPGDRGTKSKPVPGPHNVYGFLTTTAREIDDGPGGEL
jgi:hypothetical protein